MSVNRAKTKSKTWEVRIRDRNGRQIDRRFKTKAAAERWKRETLTDIARGEWCDPRSGKETLTSCADAWLAAQVHLKPSTRACYVATLRTHVLPPLGNRTVVSLTSGQAQEWVSRLSAERSPATVRKAHRVLSLVLDLAVRDLKVTRNVAAQVNLPRATSRKRRYLTHQQVDALVQGLDRRNTLVILVLAYCGLRWGEMAALKVGSVDLMRRRLSVDASVTEVRGRQVWGLPKDHERRSVPFPRFLVDALIAHCAGRPPEALLFPSAAATPLRVRNFRRDVFDRAAESIGLGGLVPHELRHTAASLAISAGASVKAVQGMLGHASAAMTLDTYADLFPDDLDRVAEALDEARASALPESGAGLLRDFSQIVSIAK
jgi:integrase